MMIKLMKKICQHLFKKDKIPTIKWKMLIDIFNYNIIF